MGRVRDELLLLTPGAFHRTQRPFSQVQADYKKCRERAKPHHQRRRRQAYHCSALAADIREGDPRARPVPAVRHQVTQPIAVQQPKILPLRQRRIYQRLHAVGIDCDILSPDRRNRTVAGQLHHEYRRHFGLPLRRALNLPKLKTRRFIVHRPADCLVQCIETAAPQAVITGKTDRAKHHQQYNADKQHIDQHKFFTQLLDHTPASSR